MVGGDLEGKCVEGVHKVVLARAVVAFRKTGNSAGPSQHKGRDGDQCFLSQLASVLRNGFIWFPAGPPGSVVLPLCC